MAPSAPDDWLEPVSAEAPAGPNLEFDSDFAALERAAEGKPEQQVGETLIPSEPPEWKDVAAQATTLLHRSRDLRVAVHLTVAQLHLRGLPGYADGLSIVQTLLHARWDEVHPQLDPEDDNDPTLRANALLRLGHPAWVMRPLRDLTLASSVRAGKVTWRDMGMASGAIETEEGQQKQIEATVRGAFQETDQTRLALTREAIATAVQAIVAIPAEFDARTGFGNAPDFAALHKLLQEIKRGMERYRPAAEAAPEPPPEEAAAETLAASDAPVADGMVADGMVGVATRPGRAASVAALTAVHSRADAMRLLELVCQYYARNEPSSPLPLLIERARRLADKTFLDILRDLAPDGVSQAQSIAGPRDE